jgi:hypothetical protein
LRSVVVPATRFRLYLCDRDYPDAKWASKPFPTINYGETAMFKDRSGNPLRRMSLPLVAITCFATSITLPMAHAVGTTGDFGKALNLTTSLHYFQVDKEKYIGQRFEFNCPARTVRDEDAQIYGTDAYPANSPICIAALHAGAVTVDGGPVTVQLNPGLNGYQGSISNNVESRDFDGTPLSIMFLTERTRDTVDELQREWAPRLQWDDKFSQTGLANIRLTGQRFVFRCPGAPQNLTGRRVYGTDSYPLNSYVCLSAVHAGQITHAGGPVLVQMDPALEGKFRCSPQR